MALGGSSATQPASAPAECPDAALARICEMNLEQLRGFWRERFASDPPAAFSKDLLGRAMCYRLQEQTFGGLSASTDRLLRALVKPGAEPPRRVKIGSVLIRVHQGVVHEVLVVPGGFCWQGMSYDSLSTIARTITGTSWNGPRFFGLRSKKTHDQEEDPTASGASAATDRKPQPSTSRKASGRSGRRSSVQASSVDAGGGR
jgi:Protein of unknown function (DUF2924)